ncbi:hypothetical protein F1D05_25955 [Kribbella qitaiheensis]|uniref:DUF4157 domain-containing protein n=2 Tax=Kribbella qitaiheensis TaxID=1544730 RepID=A0A7G6XA93_9ACTN|nr:hypothetical protein F1D05_25955 [Kribbella qitaiheensis]
MSGWQAVKLVVNTINLSTLTGVLVGVLGRARFSRGPRGLFYATGYRLKFPVAGAFTIGNLILTKHDRAYFDEQPTLIKHEERHSWQYFCLIGLPMLPLYILAASWSLLRTGCPASRNIFERLAGLDDGGYTEYPVQSLGKTLSQAFSALRSHPRGQ